MVLIPQELEGFDVADAVARMLDRPDLWWQAVGFFVQHFADWKQVWLASIGNDTIERRHVHAIRSAAANVGASRLAALAEQLEGGLLQKIAGHQSGGAIPDDLREGLAAAFDQAWGSADAAWQEPGFDRSGQK